MKIKVLFAFVILCLILLNIKVQGQTTNADTLSVLPDADIYDINGVHTTLHELAKNKVLFIDCWFIPCPPCFVAMGPLHKVYSEYASNKNVCFITICMTDSSYVKMFIRQDTVMKGYITSYQFLSGLDTFKLPVYFIDGCSYKISLGTKQLQHIAPEDRSKCPTTLFKFVSCPTGMIFDKKGKLVFKETGIDDQAKYEQRLNKKISDVLAESISKP